MRTAGSVRPSWAAGVAYATILAGILGLGGCAREIGDGCRTAINCSSRGERICDRSQPGGYCTLDGCDPGTCPDEARCVEWRGALERTSATWCMKSCKKHSDCRGAYACRNSSELVDAEGVIIASVVDVGNAEGKFCVAGSREASADAPP